MEIKNRILVLSTFFILIISSCSYENYSGADGIYDTGSGTEQYNEIVENPFVNTSDEPISTFSIDVDGGSFSNCRRMINQGYYRFPIPPQLVYNTKLITININLNLNRDYRP